MGAPGKAVDYEALLREAGLRITKPRRIILEILCQAEGHPDAARSSSAPSPATAASRSPPSTAL